MGTSFIKGYLSRNWFRILIGCLLLFVLLKKDLSFQIRLKAPTPVEQAPEPGQVPVQQTPRRSTTEKYTQQLPPEEDTGSETGTGEVDRFDFSGTGKSSRASRTLQAALKEVDENALREFIARFDRVAISEQQKFGIPASLVIGHALLLSRAGQRDMAKSANNFFALPCSSDWQGERAAFQSNCYRRYENAWTSFRDHSLYLTTGKLAFLRREHEPDDYRAWARSLEKEGFYPERNMAKQVIEVIEQYRLYELDR